MLRIREQSKALGVKATTIQKALDISSAYWSQVANYRGVLTESKLETLLDLLEFEPDEKEELIALRKIAKGRGWWNEYSALFNDELARFFGLEDGARSIRSIESGVIPGLLQTEDYIRALLSSPLSTGRPTEIGQRVRARMQRQRRLDGPDPLQLSVIIGQAALMQEIGGPHVQRDQLRHLLRLADQYPDTLELRVQSFSGASLNASTFQLLDFESSRLPTLGWLESTIFLEVVHDPKRIETLDFLYSRVEQIALDRDESLRLIDQIASQIR
ncbi:DUF5753 domain-containing protein [Nocardia amamiensis]|uniref:DUF5753 domain-containing protein n=1 Tax=Nocardia amamiensis TaxID=404578 RepID=UPI001FE05B96|nr:DUF5753 domain-containing protein [Nocardia amamiensis]